VIMPKPNVIVAAIVRVDPPQRPPGPAALQTTAAPSTVHFENGAVAMLGPASAHSSAYAGVIDELSRTPIPAYVEVDPVSQEITLLLIPLVVTVANLTTNSTGDLDVEFEISHGRHVLRAANPDYNEILNALRTAKTQGTVLTVTEDDNHEIIDVRPSAHPNGPAARAVSRAKPQAFEVSPPSVSPDRARELFVQMSGQSCDPISVPAPCIPFLYPDDGCWGRAHQMCRLIIEAGETPAKVWIYGRLIVRTRNNPNCSVSWGWHVAPTLQVATGGGVETQVIDPSLFTEPVTEPQWSGVQGDTHAVLAHTDASAFYRAPDGSTELDIDYSQTAQVLIRYRLQLKLRSLSTAGPPPYSACDADA
jgi:hypothetical protein